MLIDLFKGIAGGISIMSVFVSVAIILEEGTRYPLSLVCVLLGSLSFLTLSGNLKRPCHLLVMPGMLIPYVINCHVVQFDSGKGAVMCVMILVSGFVSAALVRRHYSKKAGSCDTGDSERSD